MLKDSKDNDIKLSDRVKYIGSLFPADEGVVTEPQTKYNTVGVLLGYNVSTSYFEPENLKVLNEKGDEPVSKNKTTSHIEMDNTVKDSQKTRLYKYLETGVIVLIDKENGFGTKTVVYYPENLDVENIYIGSTFVDDEIEEYLNELPPVPFTGKITLEQ